ncbi:MULTISPECIES: hypothetical protein [unclassified Leucobacter]|uniref:hypothetical protein n=1 Tax=unclassified Leucobacter TaxID=2621730 RepID=UPI00117B5B89|nr:MULTISPECIES: hypothetical protein [unclassified Leucobacter]
MSANLLTLEEWQSAHPERWAQIEGRVTRNELRTLKFIDAQIHLTREVEDGRKPPDTPEVRWLRSCVAIYLYVCAHGLFPRDEHSVTWVKNQRRGALCSYQVAALEQIPGWAWTPRRSSWDERVTELNLFRTNYEREPRIRSKWEHERALAYWLKRQRIADSEGRLTPNQSALLEGEPGQPTGEISLAVPVFSSTYDAWFREFWDTVAPASMLLPSL